MIRLEKFTEAKVKYLTITLKMPMNITVVREGKGNLNPCSKLSRNMVRNSQEIPKTVAIFL